MLRTTVGLTFLVLLGAASACSSKATDDNKGSGGNGSLLGGSSSGGTGGASGSTGGIVGRAGATATAGTTGNGLCPGDVLTCVDDKTATFCDPDTGVEETFNCATDAAELGFESSGCTMGTALTEDECALDSVKDAKCLAGAQGYAFCGGFTTDQQLFNIYVNCFQDYMGAHTIVQCFSDYVSATMTADSDCLAAEEACFGLGAGGAGPGGMGGDGAGGAP